MGDRSKFCQSRFDVVGELLGNLGWRYFGLHRHHWYVICSVVAACLYVANGMIGATVRSA